MLHSRRPGGRGLQHLLLLLVKAVLGMLLLRLGGDDGWMRRIGFGRGSQITLRFVVVWRGGGVGLLGRYLGLVAPRRHLSDGRVIGKRHMRGRMGRGQRGIRSRIRIHGILLLIGRSVGGVMRCRIHHCSRSQPTTDSDPHRSAASSSGGRWVAKGGVTH